MPKSKERVVKAWAVIKNNGSILEDSFMVIQKAKYSADQDAKDFGSYDNKKYSVVKCTIHYRLGGKGKKS